jgi:hypothetical protein
MPIIRAAERVADDYVWFLRSHLGKGKRGRRSVLSGGITEVDEAVRTTYYKFLERCPEIDVVLDMWFSNYVSWLNWVRSVDERGIDLAVEDYKKRGQPECADRFRAFADGVRHN